MRRLFFVLMLAAAQPSASQPSAFEAPADLFYLHPLVNYANPVRWQSAFERERVAAGGMRITVGSISTKDFATTARVELVEPAHERLRFLFRFDWDESPHVDGGERQPWFGLEFQAVSTRFGDVGVEMLVHPASDKADLDVMPGLLWTNASRRNYLRLGWRRDDGVYEDKNELGGRQSATAAGPQWAVHAEAGRFAFAGEGTWLSSVQRTYPDAERSPDLWFFGERRRWSSHAVRYDFRNRRIELRFEHRDFERVERTQTGLGDARQESFWRHVRLAWEEDFGAIWRARASVHRLHYDNAFLSVEHRRRENMGSVFVARHVGQGNWIDLGWMSTDFEWTSDRDGSVYGRDQSGLASKIAVGWTIEFYRKGQGPAWVRALISHEPDPQQFGGANVQASMTF